MTETVDDKGKGLAKEDFGQVLYNRGVVNAMLGVEAIRKAQEKYGKLERRNLAPRPNVPSPPQWFMASKAMTVGVALSLRRVRCST